MRCGCVGKGATSKPSQTCVDPYCHPDGPLLLKIAPRGTYVLFNHNYALANTYPPPPVPRNHLAQEPSPGSAVEFSHHFFFYEGIGFFMVLVDVGQLFRCVGQHFMCVATGPHQGGALPISRSQAHIPLEPLPPALDPFPEATSPGQGNKQKSVKHVRTS